MRFRWWLLLIPVAVVGLFVLALDWVLGVREVPPSPRADIPPAIAREQAREAFADGNRTSNDPADPEFAAVLLDLGIAASEGRTAAVADAFDHARFHDEILRSEVFVQSRLGIDLTGPRYLREALWDATYRGGRGFQFDRVAVRKVVPLPASDERLVYARHTAGARSFKYRWWLVRTPTGWKVYDLEDVRIGLRLTRQATEMVVAMTAAKDVAPLVAGTQALQAAADLLAAGKRDEAATALGPARSVVLPRELFVFRCVVEGGIAAASGRSTEALEWADRAETVAPGRPAIDYLRACTHAVGGNWAEAVISATRYIDQVGPDAAAGRILGTALRELGRPTEAAAAFEQALQDDPSRADLKAALREVKP
jgi:tetratricopeptide (TPR) repeat protein